MVSTRHGAARHGRAGAVPGPRPAGRHGDCAARRARADGGGRRDVHSARRRPVLLRRRGRDRPPVEGAAVPDDRLHQRLGDAQPPAGGHRGHLRGPPHPRGGLSAHVREESRDGADPHARSHRRDRQLLGRAAHASPRGSEAAPGPRRHDRRRDGERPGVRRAGTAGARPRGRAGGGEPGARVVLVRRLPRPPRAGAAHRRLHGSRRPRGAWGSSSKICSRCRARRCCP